ncbi:hypothetical protein SSBR45G_46800 [Bradyrhizobium sp. SSBR45G]|uniref:hypothetical protein n=1 Tax=unclassified Bradyrhizobium TaxID=2631580 RepID=UPI002342A214|nr:MULTISPECIES: hypothetical protein [unclassified Bradyrhizobium]GLH79771.1 hypothetical protein SSBR45G_46800 [Bradyrhizobium sp. SSBR45G]GLH87111.1 hypothetical protein SSBR45R_45710 [Bradyrhizobium sp. SSBR45R]
MRTSFTRISKCDVRVKTLDERGETLEIIYHVPSKGGYVTVNGREVCALSDQSGRLLYVSDPDALIDVMRAEYRRARRAELAA